MGNIADGDNYDPFPKTRPIKKYEPLIRKTVREYRERYPHFTYRELLIEAVRLASDAEQTFNPEKGKFGTHLRWHLKGLHRYAQKERKHEQVPIYTDPEARAEEIAEE